jgi:DNA-binding transcriptional MerR regulator
MELSSSDVAKLLGISTAQLHRYGNEGKITYRPHGPRGRRRYPVEQLRLDAQALHLSFNEELIGQLAEKKH